MTDQTLPADDNTPDQTASDATTQLQQDLAQMTETAKRALADLQNLQKRALQERMELYPTAQADLMVEFLPVIDNFARAFTSIPENLQGDPWVNGVVQIEKQFTSLLNKIGLSEINPENTNFNPNEHEAMLEVEGPANQVVQVLEKGYKFKERIIRPAKISVGKG